MQRVKFSPETHKFAHLSHASEAKISHHLRAFTTIFRAGGGFFCKARCPAEEEIEIHSGLVSDYLCGETAVFAEEDEGGDEVGGDCGESAEGEACESQEDTSCKWYWGVGE